MLIQKSEIAALEAVIGQPVQRVFCPEPSIFRSHIEAANFTIWLNIAPAFINIGSVALDKNAGFRIAIDRTETPRGFDHKHEPYSGIEGVVSKCSDVFVEPPQSKIQSIGIFATKETDVAIRLEYDDGDAFSIFCGDADAEVSLYWADQMRWIEETFELRGTIDRETISIRNPYS